MRATRHRLPKGTLLRRGATWWAQWKHGGRPFGVSLGTKDQREAKARFAAHMSAVRGAILDGSHASRFGGPYRAPLAAGEDCPLAVAWEAFAASPRRPDSSAETLKQYGYQFARFADWVRERRPEAKLLGDCCRLRWEEVDLESGSIVRRPSKTSRRADKPVVIPIHPDLRRRLDEVRPVKASGFVCPTKAEQYARNRSEVSKRFSTVFRQCGIDLDGEGGHARAPVDVGFHSLRYSFVSICRRADAPLAVVESLVGHSSLAMTRRYTDVGGEAAAKAIASLPSLADLAAAGRPAAPPEARPPPGLASMGDDDLRRLAAAVAAEAARRKA